MNLLEKAKILTHSGEYDSCGPKSCEVKVKSGLGGIYHAKAEHKTCKLFKTLMSNACAYDCKYCSNSTHCKNQKVSYEPKELASLFMHLVKTEAANGLFLTSAITGDADRTTEKMVEAVTMLRTDYQFRGYVHFKILPGTSYELVKQAAELSTRLSINIEAPNKDILSELSSCKEYKTDILRRQAWISKFKLSGGQTTQMIVNRQSKDIDIMRMAEWEYDSMHLKRVYFSAFRPVKGTPLENEKAEPMQRQNHLYNVDFLIREYNYSYTEFKDVMDNGMLPKEDPKLAIAKQSFESPLDINEASYDELIRVPGIGPRTASKILASKTRFKDYEDLHRLGAVINRARPFIQIEGKRQKMLTEF
jgi:predicted DNA-binding helix-hairpin-helix protein